MILSLATGKTKIQTFKVLSFSQNGKAVFFEHLHHGKLTYLILYFSDITLCSPVDCVREFKLNVRREVG